MNLVYPAAVVAYFEKIRIFHHLSCLMLRKCELKMLNMKRDYRSVIDHNNKTKERRKRGRYPFIVKI
jgi:hypothetical protein